MGSLADLDPPIALGALDGRYRGVVAPSSITCRSRPSTGPGSRSRSSGSSTSPTGRSCPVCAALTGDEKARLRAIVDEFGAEEIEEMARTERVTQHDVKAVEYFLRSGSRRSPRLTRTVAWPS